VERREIMRAPSLWPVRARRFCAAALLGLAVQPAAPQRTLEYDVKSAFLYNFLTFVEWPASAFTTPTSPLRVCLLDVDPFRGVFHAVVRGETVQGRPVEVDRLGDGMSASGCHVLFVPAGREAQLAVRVPALRGLPILIVGETPRVLQLCGALTIAVEGERVPFDANTAAFTERRLTASSKLLRVARSAIADGRGCR
jgi:hypothetical protein